MGSSTVFLILKSLLPFLKEILLKDRLLRELLAENKIASILAGCVLFLFLLVAHATSTADNANRENDRLKMSNEHLLESNKDLKARVEKLEAEVQKMRDRPPEPNEGPSEHHIPTNTPTPKPKKKVKIQSLRTQIELRFKTFE